MSVKSGVGASSAAAACRTLGRRRVGGVSGGGRDIFGLCVTDTKSCESSHLLTNPVLMTPRPPLHPAPLALPYPTPAHCTLLEPRPCHKGLHLPSSHNVLPLDIQAPSCAPFPSPDQLPTCPAHLVGTQACHKGLRLSAALRKVCMPSQEAPPVACMLDARVVAIPAIAVIGVFRRFKDALRFPKLLRGDAGV